MPAAESPVLVPSNDIRKAVVRHYHSGKLLSAAWDEHGYLVMLEPAADGKETDLWIAPGLCDLQINGYGGIDLQRPENVTVNDLRQLARSLRLDGCTRFFLTLITREWRSLLDSIRRYRSFIEGDSELRRTIAGWHVEGPFLSDKPGYSGAHNASSMRNPNPEFICQLKEATGPGPIMLTIAPERDGAVEAIEEAARQGMIVSLGHTGAQPDSVKRAVKAGATAFTHLGNGCPQLLDRHENILWTALDCTALTIGVIPDGIHVSPALFRLFHRAKAQRQIYWTTDAMSAAGAPQGMYSLGETVVHVGDDAIVRNPATGTFAGSALSPIEGIRRGAAMLGCSWQEAWDFLSVHPARLAGLASDLETGSTAGFCLLRSI